MEATHDGQLVRQHHEGPDIKISRLGGDGKRCRIQRNKGPSGSPVLHCPSRFVSKGHCDIFRKNRAYWIKDLGSTNGTYLNGNKIFALNERELRFGDVVGVGVSHLETDATIDLTSTEYYIYNFMKVEEETEVIDLDDDDDRPPSNQSVLTLQKDAEPTYKEQLVQENANESENKYSQDEDDIQLVYEHDSSVKAAGITKRPHHRHRSSKSPPPSPVPSKCSTISAATENSFHQTNQDSVRVSDKNKTDASSSYNQPMMSTSEPAKNKISLYKAKTVNDKSKINELIEPLKKKLKRESSSSSDDSSDGLGDVDVPTKKIVSARPNTTTVFDTYSILSDNESSQTASEEEDNESSQSPLTPWYKIAPSQRHRRPRSKSDDSESDEPSAKIQKSEVGKQSKRTTARKSTCISPKQLKQQQQRKLIKTLKRKALRNICSVKVERIIYLEDETLFLDPILATTFHNEVLKRLANQYRVSCKSNFLKRNAIADKKPKKFKRIRQFSDSDSSKVSEHSIFENNADEGDDSRSSEDKAAEEPVTPTMPTTSSAPPTKPSNRKLQVIDDAPSPRFAVKAQLKTAALKNPSPAKKPQSRNIVYNQVRHYESKDSRDVQVITKEEQKQMRSEKLKELELRRQQEKHADGETSESRIKAPSAKIKITKKNRNQSLMEDIAGKHIMDTESVVGGFNTAKEKPTPINLPAEFNVGDLIVEPVNNSKEKEVIRDPRLQKRSLEQTINESIKTSAVTPSTSLGSGPVFRKPPPPPPIIGSNGKINMLKDGADIKPSPDFGIGTVHREAFGQKPHSSRVLPFNDPRLTKSLMPEDDIYKRLCSWRPAWLEEQKKMKDDPPLTEDMIPTTTLTTYANFEAYFKTYYPLLLKEIWGTVNKDLENINRNKYNEGPMKVTEYSVKIDDINRPGYCHLIKHKKQYQQQQNPDDTWAVISYHTWTKNQNDIDIRKDFVQLTFQATMKKTNNKFTKSVFGFSESSKGRYESIDGHGKDCDSRLKKLNAPQNHKGKGYRFTETLVFKFGSNYVVDTTNIAQVRRLSYVMPKIREFRALNDLPLLKLYRHIVSPPDIIENRWKSPQKGLTSTAHLTKCCLELNTEQKSMVEYVTSRVFSDDPELLLMHGPPGTGKTKTLIAAVLQTLVSYSKKHPTCQDLRILICTPSNAAIDEIMRRMITAVGELPFKHHGKKLNIIRIGDGYSRALESYSITAKVKCKDEEESTTKSLRAELTSVELEIELMDKELEKLKQDKADPIMISAKSSQKQELNNKKQVLLNDLNPFSNRRDTKDMTDIKRQAVIRDANIICSTLSASGNSLMKNAFAKTISSGKKPFLCCIIDEASQTTEPETLLPLVLNVDKLILVGDPEQLGATVLSQTAGERGYGQSMFTRLYKFYSRRSTNPIMMLTRQYRMHKEIVSWPNTYFYEGKLTTSYQNPQGASFPLRPFYFLNLSSGRERSGAEGQIENDDEKEMVLALLMCLEQILMETKTPPLSVGVITPYAAQKAVIRRDIQKRVPFTRLTNIEVDTVDGFQGQEKDIIVLSCVRTDGTGFLKSKNRLNVALTRAKHGLYIIGDVRCLSKDEMWLCLIQDAATRNCKYDIKPNFRMDMLLLKNELNTKLKEGR